MNQPNDEVVITAALRTPIGKFGGKLSHLTAVELGTAAVKAVLEASPFKPEDVDLVIMGHARQASCGPNPARQVAIKAGLPQHVVAYTLNQACASGLAALLHAAQWIRSGEAEIVIAGGMESMSRVPYLLEQIRFGHKMGHVPLVDAMYRDGLFCPLAGMIMGETVELLAKEYKISREEQDRYAALSQQKCEQATQAGRFRDEMIEVQTPQGPVTQDEHPRSGVTPEKLAKLRPVYGPEGTITAGNASGITDGASAMVVMSSKAACKFGATPMVKFIRGKIVALDPKRMGLGPVHAIRALGDDGALDRFDLIELNEAFAAQVLACDREIPLPMERLNVNGGAIALGHPIGCTGNRITVTLIHEMLRREARRGLATLCVSGGLGIAAILER